MATILLESIISNYVLGDRNVVPLIADFCMPTEDAVETMHFYCMKELVLLVELHTIASPGARKMFFRHPSIPILKPSWAKNGTIISFYK